MTTHADTPKPNTEWSVQQLRATIFYTDDDVGARIHEFWMEAFGSMPQQDETRNLESVRVVGGQSADKRWMANIQPGRIDIASQPASIPTPGNTNVWNVFGGHYQQVVQSLIHPGHLLVDTVSGINRLAVGTLFLAPAQELSEAYAKLGVVLPALHLGDLDAPDFSFRINRRRRSQHSSGLWVNRLATWAIAQNQTVSFGPVGSGGPVASESGIRYAASLQLDINTAPIIPSSGRRIPADKAKDILTELAGMATEIVEKGDIP